MEQEVRGKSVDGVVMGNLFPDQELPEQCPEVKLWWFSAASIADEDGLPVQVQVVLRCNHPSGVKHTGRHSWEMNWENSDE